METKSDLLFVLEVVVKFTILSMPHCVLNSVDLLGYQIHKFMSIVGVTADIKAVSVSTLCMLLKLSNASTLSTSTKLGSLVPQV